MLTSRKSGNSSIPLLYYLNLNLNCLKAKLSLLFKRIPIYNIRSLFFIYKLNSTVLVSAVNIFDLIFSQELIFYPDNLKSFITQYINVIRIDRLGEYF